jgi:hypothetical protein
MPATTTTAPEPTAPEAFARRAFGVALVFLVVLAALGLFLRLQSVRPLAGVDYRHFLHAHSHVAFLGFVFNAFFALALARFVPPGELRAYRRIFWTLQIAVVGMLFSYPVQGYGAVSIAFSTLHMIGAGGFAWKLWRRNLAHPAARPALRLGLVFLVASGLGPLALGPLAACGLRESPAYQLAIYFYLHGQYNGWFVFFLLAVVLNELARRTGPGDFAGAADARRALRWLGVGAVLTLAQSTLWLNPPSRVYAVAGAGGVVQLIGCGFLLRALRGAAGLFGGAARALAGLALISLLIKYALQTASAWPGLGGLANHRFVIIAFLHLVFLGVVTPLLFAWALRLGWLAKGPAASGGLAFLVGGALTTELLLIAPPLGFALPLALPPALLAAAVMMLVGALSLALAFIFPAHSRSLASL